MGFRRNNATILRDTDGNRTQKGNQMKRTKSLILSAALATGLAAPAMAGARVELGMLDCTVEGGVNLVLASTSNLQCTFTPASTARSPETYTGTIEKYGLDLGTTENAVIRWAVVAPAVNGYAPGALAGNYGGATASASFVVGLGANVLVGGLEKSFALQPVSLQSQQGINIAVGVAALRLNAVTN
jgi:hypothetical protein